MYKIARSILKWHTPALYLAVNVSISYEIPSLSVSKMIITVGLQTVNLVPLGSKN